MAMPFMPHGTCFLWRTDILTLHVVSDGLIALSYFCIPVLLLTFVRRRPALRRCAWFFSAFILSCGTTHVMDIWTIWQPDYWLAGALKAVTALASLGTVAALLPLMPYGKALHRLRDLDRINHQLESQYRLIVETANDGLWLTDAEGRTTFVNPRVGELLGYPVAELMGKPISDFFFSTPVAAQERMWSLRAAQRGPIGGELAFLRKDGRPIWTETKVKMILDPSGTPTGAIAMIADVSQRREAEAALALSEDRYRELAEAMPHLVWSVNAAGGHEYANRAFFTYTGLTATELSAEAWLSRLHGDDAERVRWVWDAGRAGAAPYEMEFRMRRASDGAFRWMVARMTPVRDPAGAIVRWIGTAADIHDFKVASETRSVLDRLGHLIAIRNVDGLLDYMSPSWQEYTGATLGEDIHGRSFIHPDDLPTVAALELRRSAAPQEVHAAEMRIQGADGSYRWFLVRTTELPASAGDLPRNITTLTDIDDLKRTQAEYERSEARYRALTDAMPQMVWVLGAQRQVEYVNERWSQYTGRAFARETPPSTASIVHPDDLGVLAARDAALSERPELEFELRLRRHDGLYRWHLLRTVALGDSRPGSERWIVTATDIEARKIAEATLADSATELKHRAEHDPLTNLPNRAKLMERLTTLLAQAEADGTEVVVLYLDLDHFKTINDTLGYQCGDALLVETAARITATLRADDIASRFGGDEFVLVCAAAGGADAPQIAERVAAAVRQPLYLAGQRVIVTSSIGMSVFPRDGRSPSGLVQRADCAMYDAKESGRDAWNVSTSQTRRPAMPELEFEIELRDAIALDQFVVYYQPIVNAESGRPVGAEALVRWNHPTRGLLMPGDFIAVAESHGLIGAIGDFVLQAACAELARLDLRATDDFSVSVNVSARQFQKTGFVEHIAAAIGAHHIEARRLEIEITESIVMRDTDGVAATLAQLRTLGVKVSIDDFGTGYSSLAYIKNFPIDTLKIDRSFVTDIERNFTDRAIAKTIVTLAHSLGMRVIAEGVEIPAQLDLLRSFGADCIQGYLVSRPLPAAAFEAFMAGRGSALPR